MRLATDKGAFGDSFRLGGVIGMFQTVYFYGRFYTPKSTVAFLPLISITWPTLVCPLIFTFSPTAIGTTLGALDGEETAGFRIVFSIFLPLLFLL